jgi:hypothetical protein
MIDELRIPEHVTTCPECDGTLTADVYEWDGETERPTGWHLWCDRERASLETHSLMLADGQPVGRFNNWCQRSYQDGVEMDAAIEEWFDEEYPNPERGDLSCGACGSERVGPAEVRDSRRTGTLIRCRSCILSVAPEMLTAEQIATGRPA